MTHGVPDPKNVHDLDGVKSYPDSRATVARETNRDIRANIRDDWDWPSTIPGEDRITDETQWRERYCDPSSSTPSASPDPYKFEGPDSVSDGVASRKRKRRARQMEQMDWNRGLRTYVERRNKWTGGRFSAESASDEGGVHLATAGQDSEDHAHDNPQSSMITPHSVELVPIVAPLISPLNPIRSSITPASYANIYDKVIIEGITPKVPINLGDMTRAIVAGWKSHGEWPPTAQILNQSPIRRLKPKHAWRTSIDTSGLLSSGLLSPVEGSRNIAMRGVGKMRKVLGLKAEDNPQVGEQNENDEIPPEL
ncbi:hypothetical protein MMC19_005126 [Ptychographa xylographoides]|nr:hypothetical protein [Ptychographa xylographoides]